MIIYIGKREYDTTFIDAAKAKNPADRNGIEQSKMSDFTNIAKSSFKRIADSVNEFGPEVSTVAEVRERLLDEDIFTYTKVNTKLTAAQVNYILDFLEN